ncbi:MAG: hypothetical protein P1P64_03715 [Treponemataceae bacterium]
MLLSGVLFAQEKVNIKTLFRALPNAAFYSMEYSYGTNKKQELEKFAVSDDANRYLRLGNEEYASGKCVIGISKMVKN